MAIRYQEDTATFDDTVGVEAAEELLGWLQAHPAAKADLSGCGHMHAADLQVLMAAHVKVVAWPTDETLTSWLKAALAS
jgi:proteasome lid subunit RPN8/RPN11